MGPLSGKPKSRFVNNCRESFGVKIKSVVRPALYFVKNPYCISLEEKGCFLP